MNTELKKILDRDRTPNQKAFADWLIAESGMTFKSQAARDTFRAGLMLGSTTYHVYQSEKRAAKTTAAEVVAPVKRVRKPRAAKVAA